MKTLEELKNLYKELENEKKKKKLEKYEKWLEDYKDEIEEVQTKIIKSVKEGMEYYLLTPTKESDDYYPKYFLDQGYDVNPLSSGEYVISGWSGKSYLRICLEYF